MKKDINQALEEFAEEVSRIASGNGEVNLEKYMRITNPPALRQLAIALDSLLKELKSREKYLRVAIDELKLTHGKLEEMNKMLEEKVRERTKALEQANKLLESLSVTDPLTGLSNRRNLDYELKQEISRCLRYNTKLSCIMLDIDHFKKVNDTYGHLLGDEVLKMIGRVLKNHLRIHDIPARYGGEEFVILLPETGLEAAYKVAEKIRKLIKGNHVERNGEKVTVTVSCGVAEFVPGKMNDPMELIEAADNALYMAKKKGRDRTEVYTG